MAAGERKFRANVGPIKMKLKVCLFLLAFVTAALASCSADETASNSQKSSNRASNSAPQTYVDNNGQGSPANTGELANVETEAMRKARKLEEMRAAANSQSGKKPAPVNVRPAPEDSEITTTLTDVAREVRVWKKHPSLAKIEKIYDGQNISIKVYLRDGRVLDLPGTAIPQLDQVPSDNVLTLVGVAPTAAKSENPVKKSVN